MPSNYRTGKMLRADLTETEDRNERDEVIRKAIPYVDDLGQKADFHALRHTLGGALDRTKASLKERMTIMRHSDRGNLSLGTYGHVEAYDIRHAIENLPDYPWPDENRSNVLAATGTDDLARHLARQGGQIRTNTDFAGQQQGGRVYCRDAKEPAMQAGNSDSAAETKRNDVTGPVAQRLEQWTHNPLVRGSNPRGPIRR